MQLYEVWSEGYRATGEAGEAQYLGTYKARSFSEACAKWVSTQPKEDHYFFDPAKLTYWGCRLFDGEADARRSFG